MKLFVLLGLTLSCVAFSKEPLQKSFNIISPNPPVYIGLEGPAVLNEANLRGIVENAQKIAKLIVLEKYVNEASYAALEVKEEDSCKQVNASVSDPFLAGVQKSSYSYTFNNCQVPNDKPKFLTGLFSDSFDSYPETYFYKDTSLAEGIKVGETLSHNQRTRLISLYKVNNKTILENVFWFNSFKVKFKNFFDSVPSENSNDHTAIWKELEAEYHWYHLDYIAIKDKKYIYFNGVILTKENIDQQVLNTKLMTDEELVFQYVVCSFDCGQADFYTSSMYDPVYGHYQFTAKDLNVCDELEAGFKSGQLILQSESNTTITVEFKGCNVVPTSILN